MRKQNVAVNIVLKIIACEWVEKMQDIQILKENLGNSIELGVISWENIEYWTQSGGLSSFLCFAINSVVVFKYFVWVFPLWKYLTKWFDHSQSPELQSRKYKIFSSLSSSFPSSKYLLVNYLPGTSLSFMIVNKSTYFYES